jgi:hypothetical protein
VEANKNLQFMHDAWHRLTRLALQAEAFAARLPWRRIAIFSAAVAAVISIFYTLSFFWPRNINFAFAGSNCFFNPVILPGLVKAEPSANFKVSLNPTLSLGGLALYSDATCVSASHAPTQNMTEVIKLSPAGNPFFKKEIKVTTTTLPTVSALTKISSPIAADGLLTFKTDLPDELFTYQLTTNSKHVTCTHQPNNIVGCDLKKLNLAQSKTYQVELKRSFNEQPVGTVFSGQVKTIDALVVVSSNVSAGEKIFSIPTDISLSLNKTAQTYHGLKLTRSDNHQELPITHALSAKTINIHLSQPLPRGVSFSLNVGQIIGEDGSHLDKPFSLGFSTSGGPQVAGISIGSYKVSTGASITITFDSALAANQNFIHFIRLERDAGQMDASYRLSGARVTITPKGGMPGCTAFKVTVIDGLKSSAGISGGSGTWVYRSRTICQTVFSIGSSVNGRSILAYKFGSGARKIIFTGGVHGNEKSSAYILRSLIDYLEANIGLLPANHTIVIIPVVNPDGYAVNQRTNAHNVDLNRNFPANNWKPGVTEPNGSYLPYGGGTAPLSEPESRALANYVAAQNPVVVMSYHAAAHLVAANESGGSLSWASSYGHKIGYPVYGNEAAGQFDYDTTGAFEDWLHDAHSIPCILVELITKTGNEFTRQRAAMLDIIKL